MSLKRIQITQGKNDGWVLQIMNHRREKTNFRLWVRCSAQVLSAAFAKWLAIPADKQAVELVMLGILRKSKLFFETEFLSLAQALEGFGRIRFAYGKKRSPNLRSLIERTYDLLSLDFAERLLGDRSAFTKNIVETRTYYTHLGSVKKGTATQDNRELFELNQKLQAFLRCVMLIDLGVPEEYLKEPILYQPTRYQLR